MLLTLSTTHKPAEVLGFLLRKNPARVHEFSLNFGIARVFYPEVSDEKCTAVLSVEVDPVGLVRRQRNSPSEGGLLDQYVNDRPYAASSFMSVAIADVFSSALGGHAKEYAELVDAPLPLTATISALPCAPGEDFLRRLFEPLGHTVTAERLPLAPRFPEWGESVYYRTTLAAHLSVRQMLSHLYVLLPVLDNKKHYYVSEDEVQKLLHHGEGWLATHPEREIITRRYLKYRRNLIHDALDKLIVPDGLPPDDETDVQPAPDATDSDAPVVKPEAAEGAAVAPDEAPTLHEQRLAFVLAALKASGAKSVLDLGCGAGRLLRLLLAEHQFERIAGMDVAHHTLEVATVRLRLDRLPPRQRARIQFIHGSLTYRDTRLAGFDAAAIVEVIEHLDPPRLAAFERVVFENAAPRTVVLTTPNREYNVKWETLPAGKFRHRDHRFEWSRDEFSAWATRVAARFVYRVRLAPVGPEDALVGAPSQAAIFEKADNEA
ncbi:MAG: 3' terminal RNA ribose 2'-O-methyltransferase Hen1 [Puniceicoccales bacterium]|jgi:3' terminal RNA ribose 2'-O-methyltransferase Hen1|nr:3' terminal RNA ribose 2'-O-methyltransferase Hen1 [Puniceicoccales bacterium]